MKKILLIFIFLNIVLTIKAQLIKDTTFGISYPFQGTTDSFSTDYYNYFANIQSGSIIIGENKNIFFNNFYSDGIKVDSIGLSINTNWQNINDRNADLLKLNDNHLISLQNNFLNVGNSFNCSLNHLNNNGVLLNSLIVPHDTDIWSSSIGYDMALLSDSSILLTVYQRGNQNSINFPLTCNQRLYKFKKNFTIDSSFGINGHIKYSSNILMDIYNNLGEFDTTALPIQVDLNDNIYLGVKSNFNSNSVIRYNKYGIYDSIFNSQSKLINTSNSDVTAKIIINYDGDLLLIGNKMSITKLKNNGIIDSTFLLQSSILGNLNNPIKLINVVLQPDNNIDIVGSDKYQGYFYKKDKNGIDVIAPSFFRYYESPNHPCNSNPIAFNLQEDGKILIAMTYEVNPWTNGWIGHGLCRIIRYLNNQCGNGNIVSTNPILTSSNSLICSGDNSTINVIGNLNSASYWQYYTDLDSTKHQIYGNTININPTSTTKYYIQGVGPCVNNGQMDSITINVISSTSSTQNVTVCNSYFFNNQTLTNSGIYYDTLQNANGCDSLIELNLTINNTTSSTQNITTCNTYFFNNQTLTNSGIYYDTLQNANGCDSLIELNLTINSVSNNYIIQHNDTLVSSIINVNYQWITCNPLQIIVNATSQNYLVTSNGDFAVIVSQNGCNDTSICFSFLNLGFEGIGNIENTFQVYPNPVCSVLYIKDTECCEKYLYNSVGILILTTKENEIDTRNLSKGVYYLRVGNLSKKVIVQ
jgi:hypothetical protein